MLEESFASIFAEVCINNARKDNEQFEMLNSVKYQRYESEVRGLLYVLKQNNIDLSDAVEWIEYNTIRSLPYAGDKSPIIMYTI